MNDSKNEIAWAQLFKKYKIDETIKQRGWYIVHAKDMNEFREARLMTKFDHRFQLPKTLSDRKLSVLPISRGSYVLSDFELFENFDQKADSDIAEFTIPSYIESLDFSTITSESLAINCAYVSGIIADFVQDDLVPAVAGRMSSGTFDFDVKRIGQENSFLNVEVQNAQIEIDGGYEGVASLNLIEAKNNLSEDFLIRQLYYPYRLWQNKVHKIVRPIFLVYTNGTFHFREYQFDDLTNYNSITLIREKRYRLKNQADRKLNVETIQKILCSVVIVDEPTTVPLPQADSFDRVINLCEILYNNTDEDYTKGALSRNYDFKERDSFDMRQVDYYTNAAIYLGFVKKTAKAEGVVFELTDAGVSLFRTGSIVDRQLKFIEAILSHGAFNRTLKLYFQKAEMPTREEVVRIMKDCGVHNIKSEETFTRRAGTILSWLKWILGMADYE